VRARLGSAARCLHLELEVSAPQRRCRSRASRRLRLRCRRSARPVEARASQRTERV
jgi:hypothetical protein